MTLLLHLSDQSADSLQQQIVRQIRAKVLGGELAADADLPSIRGFARDHQVSVITVQRAYESLERLGLIHSRRGKGFFVSARTAADRSALARSTLADRIREPIAQARAEGLSDDQIRAEFSNVLAARAANPDKENA